MKDKLYELLLQAFSKNDRDSYIELSDHITQQVNDFNEEIKSLKSDKEDALNDIQEQKNTRFKFAFIACILFFCRIFIGLNKTLSTAISNTPFGTMLEYLIYISIFSFVLLAVSYKFICKSYVYDIDCKIKNIQKRVEKYTIFQSFLCCQIDLIMYKDIYQKIYDIQEHLKNNDKEGYESFVNAANALNVDLSKYVKKS